MPRRARIVLPGFLHHVTQRGNNKQDVFFDDQDRLVYLKYVQRYCQDYAVGIYAYCLMNNHVHFIAEPQEKTSLARAFNVAHQRYSYYLHKKRGKYGHLWQGRFYSCVLHGRHIVNAVRYVERNPVRAGFVKRAWEYAWSSARVHVGKPTRMIALADAGRFFDVSDWRTFLTENEDAENLKLIRERTFCGSVAASDEFIRELESRLGIRVLPKRRGRPKKSGCHQY